MKNMITLAVILGIFSTCILLGILKLNQEKILKLNQEKIDSLNELNKCINMCKEWKNECDKLSAIIKEYEKRNNKEHYESYRNN